MGEDSATVVRCRQCDRALADGEPRETTAGGVFCAPCFAALRQHLETLERRQGEGVNHVNAAAGGLAGGALGAAIWWGFTVITHVALGLVALVIGWTVGRGVLLGAGGRRARSLQAISAAIAVVAYGYASYLVNRSFILAADAGLRLPLWPSAELFAAVVRAGLDVFDAVFLAIVVYQAWRMPAPFRLAR